MDIYPYHNEEKHFRIHDVFVFLYLFFY